MSRRIKIFIVIELFIVVALLLHILRSPSFLLLLALAVSFSILARKIKLLRPVSAVLWIFLTIMLLTAGWFWLALLFPIFVGIRYWKSQIEAETNAYYGQSSMTYAEDITRVNGNDIIDLYDINFKANGNDLSIKKIAGNTKIIVPDDVAVALEVTAHNGIVKIFDEVTEINPRNFRYFSDRQEESPKRIRIKLQVETGNVEVVKG